MEIYKADLKDRKILYELDMNAKQPITQIAKKVRLSPQVVDYRIKSLEANGIILGYRALIDNARLGFQAYRLYIRYENVTPAVEKEIFSYFQAHPNVVWFISTTGRFDLEVLFLARNSIHFNYITQEIMKKYGLYLRNNVTSISITNYHHKRDWLIGKKISDLQVFYGGEPKREDLDSVDLEIINNLSLYGKMSNIELAKKLKMVPNAVKHRIKNLENRGILKAYRPWINTFKIGYQYYKALVTLKYIDEAIENKILQFCKQEPNLLYLVTCIGQWNIEVEVEVPDNETFREIMTRFRNLFTDLILDYETLFVYKEHKLDYFPLKKLEE